MNELVEEWVNKAEGNYKSALVLAKNSKLKVFDVICNQCQQCAEKYLKAILVRHQVAFPKTHDMKQLYTLVSSVEPDLRLLEEQVLLLDPFGIDIRYPGLQATADEMKQAIQAMKEIRKFARARLALKTK